MTHRRGRPAAARPTPLRPYRASSMQPIVIRFGRLGDMLLLAPLLQRLHRGYGKPCLLLGVGPWSTALYAGHPDVARVIQVNARHRPLALAPHRWQMASVLRAHRDACVHVCESEPRALAKIRRMLALAGVARERCVLLADAPVRDGEHWIDRLLRAAGGPPPAYADAWRSPALPSEAAPRLRLRAADRDDCEAWLRARGWRGEPVWLVQPANRRSVHWTGLRHAADDAKSWPVACWARTLAALRAQHSDARIVVCGTAREAPLLRAIAGAVRGGACDFAAGELPLRRLMALAARADGMLSIDTGPAHVAAAMGCPLVVLFGAQAPATWCPRSPTGSAVIALGGPPGRARVDAIAPEEVVAALARLAPREPRWPRAA